MKYSIAFTCTFLLALAQGQIVGPCSKDISVELT